VKTTDISVTRRRVLTIPSKYGESGLSGAEVIYSSRSIPSKYGESGLSGVEVIYSSR
jgi:hypothetical protein